MSTADMFELHMRDKLERYGRWNFRYGIFIGLLLGVFIGKLL